ncbi:MAG: class I SAM-dependent methyltransferase [Deltaproteobacteria bacterium]|nr:class I SAM-dependent methyltransferase [Deltaproteobacteria bacterium]
MSHEEAPHSAAYLTDARDEWWNPDWLELLARRLELPAAREILDVGCGMGHFTRVLARLAPQARVTGVDREKQWVEEARAVSARALAIAVPAGGAAPPATRCHYVEGAVEALPFPDASFDVVACQTLLIHVRDVVAALGEMARVLRPGGRIVAAEPNNLAECYARLVADPAFDLEDAMAFVRLQATCEKGKHALGLGYNSAGEGLCGAFAAAGLVELRAFTNDRCPIFLPPHDGPARLGLEQDRVLFDEGGAIWPLAETRRYFAAGGGDEAAFAELWARARRAWGARLSPLHTANEGGLFYVVTGRR